MRKGQFEGIRDAIGTDEARAPDYGDAAVHATAGITGVGVRFFLIAYNVNLRTQDVDVAKAIAMTIREKGGGMPGVRAMGFDLPQKGQVQVSMNLVAYRKTSPVQVFDEIARLADKADVEVDGSEVSPDKERRRWARWGATRGGSTTCTGMRRSGAPTGAGHTRTSA